MNPPRTKPKRWLKLLLVLALLAVTGMLARYTLFRPAVVPVTVFLAGTGRVEDTVVNSRAGTVESRKRAGMSPGISGLVVEIPARKGARVRQGEVLLRLDDSEHKARVQLAENSLAAARSAAEQARQEAQLADYLWQRTDTLARDKVVSETRVEEDRTRALIGKSAATAAEARIQEAASSLEVARATLAKTVITAPFDGIVLDVTTEVGEWISPSPPGVFIPPVIDLIDPDALYVSAPIDEADVERIRVGLPVRITLDAFRGQSFDGTLSYASSYVETRQEQNRTLRVEAVFRQTELPANLLPGLSADLEVILEARDNVLRVPTYALLEGGRVLVLEDGVLAERTVTTGLRNWSFTEIDSGLSAGDPVVVSLDRSEVKAGARAVIQGETDR
ncbi:MAG: efflux RND transporter periplasmic adaptor subunit [Verrucomicrobiales bacterium]|nr:efflux RND transporter periplasmic adaptor subunit [Verrucomicrobiales bacterium]